MFKLLKKRLAGGQEQDSKKSTTAPEYDKRHGTLKSNRSSFRRRAVPSTKDIATGLPPLPKHEYTSGISKTEISRSQQKSQHTLSSELTKNYYIYDLACYKGPVSGASVERDTEFDIFQKPNGITPTSANYVIHSIAEYFKKEVIGASAGEQDNSRSPQSNGMKAATEFFKPNLSHYSRQEIQETKEILRNLFLRDGCSLKGELLDNEIKRQFENSKTKPILALRLLWSHLPQGIIPWESYLKFCRIESKHNFSKMCFQNFLPQVLPNDGYKKCVFDFMGILMSIIAKVDLVVDKNAQMDLIFTAGQVCFVKTPELIDFVDKKAEVAADSLNLTKQYVARGEALHRLFVSYLRCMAEEGEIKDFYLIDTFELETYPPTTYRPMTQKALTLTIPQMWDPQVNRFNELLKCAAKASKRIYSSNHTFSKLENTFLDSFDEEPYRVINNLFSRSSKRYLYRFDKSFDTDYFKKLSKRQMFPALQSTGSNDHDVATWINSCKERGFNDFLSVLDDNCFGEGTLALGLTNKKAPSEQTETFPAVRVSKMDVSEWFISSWKYETFLENVHNTLVIKLTKKIGDCEWLVVTTDERVAKSNQSSNSNKSKTDAKTFTTDEPLPPLVPRKEGKMHTASSSISSTKSRPRPPNLLGDASSSPLLDDNSWARSDCSSIREWARVSSGSPSLTAPVRDKELTNYATGSPSSQRPHSQASSSRSLPPIKKQNTPKHSVDLSSTPENETQTPGQTVEDAVKANDIQKGSELHKNLTEGTSEETTQAISETEGSCKPAEIASSPLNSSEISKDVKELAQVTESASPISQDRTLSERLRQSSSPKCLAEKANLSPLACSGAFRAEKEAVCTPVDKVLPSSPPRMPMKLLNPSEMSLEDTTAVADDTAEDSIEICDAEGDQLSESKRSHPFSAMVQRNESKASQEKKEVRESAQFTLGTTADLLSDLLDNYGTATVEPSDHDSGPTVFEQIKLKMEASNAHESPLLRTSSKDAETVCSKNATWFSCNVTPPTEVRKQEVRSLIPSIAKISRNSDELHAKDDDDDLDTRGVWLQDDSEKDVKEQQSMLHHVVLKTKRSLRNLRDKKTPPAAVAV
ncbi:LAMI_0C01662g1_1 [Lachancea mirantina]|uniref:LAMI_0C01662g1_1 n=1 Tax=Lachancea mirantina TaxID=1230905 RepID=A0A1G4J0C3_9SACH|nr:LAMI_0C01662g1_1 [Lachancea mirantina]